MSEERRIVVTGASSGIGRELAIQLAAPGCRLWLIGRNRERLDEVSGRVREAGGEAHPLVLDLSDLEASARVIDEQFGGGAKIDELYLSAAVSVFGEVRDLKIEDWERVYRTDLLSYAQWLREVYAAMVEKRRGRIVIVSSLSAYAGYPTAVPYAGMKAGLLGMFRSIDHEARRHGVDLHIASPGYVDTRIYEAAIYRGTDCQKTLDQIRGMGFGLMSAEAAAKAILRGVQRGKREFAFPGYGKLLAWLSPRVPAVFKLIHARMIKRFRKAAGRKEAA
jgi:short-subunit dehydrogenase